MGAPQSRTPFALAFGRYADTLMPSRRWDRPQKNAQKISAENVYININPYKWHSKRT